MSASLSPVCLRRIVATAGFLMFSNAGTLMAQVSDEAPQRAGASLEPGLHPYLAIAPVAPLGRLGDLTSIGVSGHLGAWYVPPRGSWPGLGIEAMYASLSRDTDEALPGRYRITGASLQLTSKGKRRVFFDWLGAYASAGAGVYRHGASDGTMLTSAGASAGLGVLTPVYGAEGFIEARFLHLFSGETLGRGNGLTMAPLIIGLRF